jgi:hypothetical protein
METEIEVKDRRECIRGERVMRTDERQKQYRKKVEILTGGKEKRRRRE